MLGGWSNDAVGKVLIAKEGPPLWLRPRARLPSSPLLAIDISHRCIDSRSEGRARERF
jgi:hypothetical protein